MKNAKYIWNFNEILQKGTKMKDVDRKGQKNNLAKLTAAQVLEIRELYKHGAKQVDLAKEYGVIQGHISLIINRKSWKHI
jgi:ribosomal protein L11